MGLLGWRLAAGLLKKGWKVFWECGEPMGEDGRGGVDVLV